MAEKQLSFFDEPAARKYQRHKRDAELDAFLVSILGVEGAKCWHDKRNARHAKLEEMLNRPRSSEIQAAINAMQAKVLASTKPLADKYALLGVEQGATKRDIKNAYRRKARKVHPDVGGDAEAFKQLHETYRQLLALAKA